MTAYKVLVPLTYPTDPEVIRRLSHGDAIPWGERMHVRAPVGTIVTNLPRASIRGLLDKGWIERVEDPAEPEVETPDEGGDAE